MLVRLARLGSLNNSIFVDLRVSQRAYMEAEAEPEPEAEAEAEAKAEAEAQAEAEGDGASSQRLSWISPGSIGGASPCRVN